MKPAPLILAFDVFGTVVDWHGSISREVAALALLTPTPGEPNVAAATAPLAQLSLNEWQVQ